MSNKKQSKSRKQVSDTSKKKTRSKSEPKLTTRNVLRDIKNWFVERSQPMRTRRASFMLRRPHRSFQLTRRRDYARSLKIPGYFAFTLEVSRTLWQHKWTFLWLGIIFLTLTIAFGLLGSQDTYKQFGQLLQDSEPEGLFSSITGEFEKAGILLLTITTTGISTELSDTQRIIAVLFSLYTWLTVVWLLRNMLAGKKVKLRDGLYSAGAPILSTFLLFVVLLIQLVPAAIAVIVATAAWGSGFIQEGVASMAAGLGLTLIVVASLYWVVSTFFALVVVTLPGMYPFRAFAIAGDLVVGRRLRLLYRLIWLFITVISWWVVIMIPVILLDGLLKSKFDQIEWVPVVPFFMLVMSTFTIVWTAAYIYLLYRKVVDDDASPA
ncbi:hypothetical protein I8H89_04070 [Candidatus Saccharibacteria bacterium]|nr:hypothetical protein [Candidatus Saccharibacteria bacterium]